MGKTMLISLEEKELKKLINKAILGVLSELVAVADREGIKVKTSKSAFFTTSSIWQTGKYIM